MDLKFPTGSGALAPRTAIHRRIVDLTDTVGRIEDKVVDAIAVKAELDDLRKRVAALEGAGAGVDRKEFEDLKDRIETQERRIALIVSKQFLWLYRFLQSGCDSQRQIQGDRDPTAKLLADAKYATLDAVAKVQAKGRKSPGAQIYEQLDKVYRADPAKYTSPPSADELQRLHEIAVELTK